MRPLIRALLALTALGVALPAAAQQQQQLATFSNEVSLFGMWEDRRDPDEERSDLFLRYGRYFRPQLVGTLGLQRSRLEAGGLEASTTALTVGAKYYFTPPRANAIVPFLDGAIGVAHIDNGDSSTDLTWEFGGGVSWFFTAATSFDAGLRLFHTDTDVETKGTRLFVGITTRF